MAAVADWMNVKLARCSYVSKIRPEPLAARGGVDAIVGHAATRNAQRGITGALIYSGGHFAQILEGPVSDLRTLFDRIRADERHVIDAEIEAVEIGRREFRGWSLCYAGGSVFVARIMADFRDTLHSPTAGARMLALMAAFSRAER